MSAEEDSVAKGMQIGEEGPNRSHEATLTVVAVVMAVEERRLWLRQRQNLWRY